MSSTTTTYDVQNSSTASSGFTDSSGATSSNGWFTTGKLGAIINDCCNYYGNVLLQQNFENQTTTTGCGTILSSNVPIAYMIMQQSSATNTGTYFSIPLFIPDLYNTLGFEVTQYNLAFDTFYNTSATGPAVVSPPPNVISGLYAAFDLSYDSLSINVYYTQSLVYPSYLLMPGVGLKVWSKANYKGTLLLDIVNSQSIPFIATAETISGGQPGDTSCEFYFVQQKTNGNYYGSIKIQDNDDPFGTTSSTNYPTSDVSASNITWSSTGDNSEALCTSYISNLLIGQHFEKPGLRPGSGSMLSTGVAGAYFASFSVYFDDTDSKVIPEDASIGQNYYIPIFNSIPDCTQQIYSCPSTNGIQNNYYEVNPDSSTGKPLPATGATSGGGGSASGYVSISSGLFPILILLMPNYGLKGYGVKGYTYDENTIVLDIVNKFPFPILVCPISSNVLGQLNLYYCHLDKDAVFVEAILIQQFDDFKGKTASSTYQTTDSSQNELVTFFVDTGATKQAANITYAGRKDQNIANPGNVTIGQNFEYPGNIGGWGSVLSNNVIGAYFVIQDTFEAGGSGSIAGYFPVTGTSKVYTPSGYFVVPITGTIQDYEQFIFGTVDNGSSDLFYNNDGNTLNTYNSSPGKLTINSNGSTPSAICYLIMPNFGLKVWATFWTGGIPPGSSEKVLDIVNNNPYPILVQSTNSSTDQSCELFYCQMNSDGSYPATNNFPLPTVYTG